MDNQVKRDQVVEELEKVIAEAVYPDRPRKFMISLELAENALALLKKQEPIKPLKMAVNHIRKEPVVFSYECPVCMCGLQLHWVVCPICGQAVKWI